MGKVLLASNRYDGHGARRRRSCRSYTPATMTDWDGARPRAAATVLERGWADEVEELVVGVASIAAPILDRRGVTVGAIGISGPVERLMR